jgi:hypothetical protein
MDKSLKFKALMTMGDQFKAAFFHFLPIGMFSTSQVIDKSLEFRPLMTMSGQFKEGFSVTTSEMNYRSRTIL